MAQTKEEVKMDGEPAKRRKLDEAATKDDEEMKEETADSPKELEVDDARDKRTKIDCEVHFDVSEATLNVIPMLGGRVLMPLTDGGLQYLVAGARANVGIKKGRYMYEVKIIEPLNPAEPTAQRVPNRPTIPRQIVRVGFSTQDSSLFLGDTDESVCFDTEAFFTSKGIRTLRSQRFGRDQTIAILLNLDKKSPNMNTVSLFRDGERISQPQPLPECLHGKTLFPHVNFKNVSVQVSFGPSPLVPLPFACRTMKELAKEDALVVKPATPPGGQYEVLFPVGLPDEGTFDWLDQFLEKNPKYTELSDRSILSWAEKSCMWRPRNTTNWKNSNDKPEMNFGNPMMDDLSIRRVINSVIASQPRNYVVMEIKSNLVAAERAESMKRFCQPHYKRVAQVVVGEPPSDFKARMQGMTLAEKTKQAELEWTQRKELKERKRAIEEQQAQMREARRKAEEELRKRIEANQQRAAEAAGLRKVSEDVEMKKEGDVKKEVVDEKAGAKEAEATASEGKMDVDKADGEGAKTNGDEAKKEGEEAKKEEVKEEEVKEEEVKKEVEVKKEEEAKKEEAVKKEEEEDEAPPTVELTKEEQAMWFRKKAVPDLTQWVLSNNFGQFSIPDEDEGFDELRFEWAGKDATKDYLKQWVLKNKVLCRIEDIQPSDWFRGRCAEWQKVLQEWHAKQSEFKDPTKLAAKAAEEAAKKAEAEKKKNEGEDAEAPEEPAEQEEDEKKEINDDIFKVEDVRDVGNGEPLFARFTFEDWALLSVRVELHLLVHAFKKDVDDPERVGIHEQHLPFYYNKYFRKSFNVKYYGVETNIQLVELVKDSIAVNQTNMVLEAQQADDVQGFDIFVKLTEENRRDRQRRIDAGDETVKLKIAKPEAPPPPRVVQTALQPQRSYPQPPPQPQRSYQESGQSKGSGKRDFQQTWQQPQQQQQQQWSSYGSGGGGKAGGGASYYNGGKGRGTGKGYSKGYNK